MAILPTLTGTETVVLANGDRVNVETLVTQVSTLVGGGDVTKFANGAGGYTAPSGITTATHSGTFVCNGVTPVTVADVNVTANSVILATLKTIGGTVGAVPAVKTITPTTGFTIAGSASDSSTYNYTIFG